ncbi:hypothetical protein HHI36_003565 [Cryptolaemus montrouzieri]|uniref:Microtubule-associated protein Jupiter n=1 Tax=Cryptolaemus montrouzieri TaxID=559131 RepID=A0ABD2PDQ6_9CUCU
MSFITVGYSDKLNGRKPIKPPGGGMSEIFSNLQEQPKNNNKIEEKTTVITNNSSSNANGDTETKICQKVESLKVEENSNEVKTTVESKKTEVKQTTQTNNYEASVNGNTQILKDEKIKTETIVTSSVKPVNNIIHSDEKDSATPQRRTRVPPGGYSSGLW